MALNVGDKAPNFEGAIDENKFLSLKDLKGKWFVLYFYPKDNTSGCTKEACSFRDNMEEITKLGVEVIGVSPDSLKSHNNFKTKFNLNFHLIADPDKTICNAFDIMGEKSMYGKKYIGVIRTTYIIDDKGKIRKVFSNVKVDGHVAEVINAINELKK